MREVRLEVSQRGYEWIVKIGSPRFRSVKDFYRIVRKRASRQLNMIETVEQVCYEVTSATRPRVSRAVHTACMRGADSRDESACKAHNGCDEVYLSRHRGNLHDETGNAAANLRAVTGARLAARLSRRRGAVMQQGA